MVRIIHTHLFIIFFFFPFILFSQEVTITSQIEGENVVDKPLKGSITITHRREAKVEPNSFILEGKSLKATFQKDVVISSNSSLIISIYQFEIPGQKKGLQILPEISVKVGGKVYSSVPTTYEVTSTSAEKTPVEAGGKPAPEEKPATEEKPAMAEKVILGLEPFVDGSRTLYPGQRVKVGYKYIFNYNFNLTKEVIPLLDAKGFRPIGDKVFKNSTQGGLNTVEVTLIIEAIKPGTYTFGPSLIQGKAYVEDIYGDKKYFNAEYTANAPVVTLQVDPFPEMGKPPSFKGAIGEFTMDLTLLSPPEMTVGDKILLQIAISGTGEIENVPMPDICCQPGFSGFFRMSDLPPVEKVQDGTKTFVVEMRPLSDSIHEIPPLEFSFFNPSTITYSTVKSKPIPIKVMPLKEDHPNVEPETPAEIPAAPAEPVPTSSIEIEGNYPLTNADLSNSSFGTWWVLLILPLGGLALYLQFNYRNDLEQQKAIIKTKSSHEFFEEALRAAPGSSEQYNGLRQCLMVRLVERGEINSASIPTDQLPKEGLPGEVRAFLMRVEELRFAGKVGHPNADILGEAQALYTKLEGDL